MELGSFLPAMVVMAVIDAPWLWFTANVIKDPFYTSGGGMKLWAAVIVYIALAFLLLRQTNVKDAFLTGAATYAVYDFTVLAVRSDFRWTSAVLDTLWGGVLFAATFKVLKQFDFI
jgi:uncharacterized membrane protein